MFPRLFIFFLIFTAGLLPQMPAAASELQTRYATIVYDNDELLRAFNDRAFRGGGSLIFLRRSPTITIRDEAKNNLDNIVEKVQAVLEMFPSKTRFTLVLLPQAADVQRIFWEKNAKKVNYIAFYSPDEHRVYVSVQDVNLRVIAHEIGHVVVEHYFDVAPRAKIHELLAQYAEKHISD